MKKSAKKSLSFLLILAIYLFTAGCFNYRDVNRTVFATTLILDYDPATENVVIFLETFRPSRDVAAGTEKGQRILFKGKGKTTFEAVRDANLSSSYKINYTQNKAVIFTEKLATLALKKVIDFIDRDQEFLVRPYVFVYVGDPEQLIKMDVREEDYLGTYLFNLVQNVGTSSRAAVVIMNEYLSKRLMASKTDLIPIITIKKDQIEPKVELDGGAILENDKLVETLRKQEMQGYNFLINEVRTGTLEVTNPFHEENFVTLEILSSNTKTKVKHVKDKFKLIKEINVLVTLGESQHSFVLAQDSVEKLTKAAEDNIKRYTTKIFNDYRAKELDFFEVQEDVYRAYPKLTKDKVITDTDLEVKVNVRLEGSSDKTSNTT